MADYDVNAVRAYIRKRAAAMGMDQNVAERVAETEGLGAGIWQSRSRNKAGVREPSYGPWQFLVGGGDTGFPEGMGNRALAAGFDPRDPANVYKMTDMALDRAKGNGWADWYGARDNGIGRWQGIPGRGNGLTLNSGPPAASALHPEIDPAAPAGMSITSGGGVGAGAAASGTVPIAPNGSFMDNLKGAFKDPKSDLMTALGGFMGGMKQQPEQASAPIQSILPSMEGADAARTQGAAQLMATLLAKKKKAPMGLNLMGMT